jgi:hypothetical protein
MRQRLCLVAGLCRAQKREGLVGRDQGGEFQELGSTSSVTNGVVRSDLSCDERRASLNLSREELTHWRRDRGSHGCFAPLRASYGIDFKKERRVGITMDLQRALWEGE